MHYHLVVFVERLDELPAELSRRLPVKVAEPLPQRHRLFRKGVARRCVEVFNDAAQQRAQRR